MPPPDAVAAACPASDPSPIVSTLAKHPVHQSIHAPTTKIRNSPLLSPHTARAPADQQLPRIHFPPTMKVCGTITSSFSCPVMPRPLPAGQPHRRHSSWLECATSPGLSTLRCLSRRVGSVAGQGTANVPVYSYRKSGLRGPVLLQMSIHYLMFLVLLFIAYQTSWAPAIRFYMAMLYCLLAIVVLQVARMTFTRNPTSVWSYYLSLAPFTILIFVSREAHQIAMVLWYASFLIIYLQSGHLCLPCHLTIYSFLFGITYSTIVYSMTLIYTDGCDNWACAVALTDPIQLKYEAILLSACVVLVLQFMSLEHFVQINGEILLIRENHVKSLRLANLDLKRRLRLARDQKKDVDLEAPLSKATQILRDLKDTFANDATLLPQFDSMLRMLASDSFFSHQPRDNSKDLEVNNWITELLLKPKDHASDVASTPPVSPTTAPGAVATSQTANSSSQQTNLDTNTNTNETSPTIPSSSIVPASSPDDFTNSNTNEPSTSAFQILAAIEDGSAENHLDEESAETFTPADEITRATIAAFTLLPESSLVYTLLEDIQNPNFNIFELDSASNNQSLFYIGWHLIKQHDLASKLHIPDVILKTFLLRVQMGYSSRNPYHNASHAADVTHAMHYFASRDQIWPHLTNEEKFATIVAPLIHDFNHPGVDNAFMIATFDTLALRYNDQAVLENFHCASVFEMMQKHKDADVFCYMTTESRKVVREMTVGMVLATDMGQHFDILGKYKTRLSSPEIINITSSLDKKLILNIAIKCADVNNPTKPLELCCKWTDLIIQEFFIQGDKEREGGLPISPFMNRDTSLPDIPKWQMAFLDFFAIPMYIAFSGFMTNALDSHLENLRLNRVYWKGRAEEFQRNNTNALPDPSGLRSEPNLQSD
ncbi:hypothetical protein SeMB42_g03892 [Synchytrium endobioticum]|uniref:Phosphodiesterase n=1 Tax=Synchytrium endobioticum TaxID=286115 RepID=A0A507CJT7_9FUNG|nr:hypothetical protein SeLEV6574_g06929 [Synchytrium endobioticum]TPX45739.1 hypothetical protein SeMB42_g03892 [Synchytrium endobioticum]